MDVGIVGAGIVGLAHAWMAAERGHRVTLFERSPRALGASIRNFGMIWPIGQPGGEPRRLAMRSRERWLRLGRESGLWVHPCGSLHLAHRDDEWAVLEEFAAASPTLGVECRLVSPAEIAALTPAANPDCLRGGLYSPTELCINPPSAVRALPEWLAGRFGVTCRFGTPVRALDPDDATTGGAVVVTADGRSQRFDRVIVCSGGDLRTLFPEILGRVGLRPCKLQMLKTPPQPAGWRLGPHLAGGLTLRHYRNFEGCTSLPSMALRIAEEAPELDRFGIHVMAAQNEAGEVILGDSHEYGDAIEPFDSSAIDDLILRELRRIVRLPDWTIAARWHGIYAKHPEALVVEEEPMPGVHLCVGPGGAGMTLAFGIAERAWERWDGHEPGRAT